MLLNFVVLELKRRRWSLYRARKMQAFNAKMLAFCLLSDRMQACLIFSDICNE